MSGSRAEAIHQEAPEVKALRWASSWRTQCAFKSLPEVGPVTWANGFSRILPVGALGEEVLEQHLDLWTVLPRGLEELSHRLP